MSTFSEILNRAECRSSIARFNSVCHQLWRRSSSALISTLKASHHAYTTILSIGVFLAAICSAVPVPTGIQDVGHFPSCQTSLLTHSTKSPISSSMKSARNFIPAAQLREVIRRRRGILPNHPGGVTAPFRPGERRYSFRRCKEDVG